ncbi:MAG TPA: hypothetical protein VGA78_11345 [Gemmatimonadales bacterium]
MPRVLLARRTRVTLAAQPIYRRAAAELAARFAGRGQHVWVFRSTADPELLLEFREAKDPAGLEPAAREEAALDARLHAVAEYDTGEPLWEEFPLSEEG